MKSQNQNNKTTWRAGNCKWLGHNRCYSLQLIWLRWQELQNQLKSGVKRKRGNLELHSTNIDLPTVITNSCDSDNQFHGFFSCSFARYVLFVSSSKRKLAISDDSGYCCPKNQNLYFARKFDAWIVCVNRNCTGTSCTCINNQLTQNRIWKWETI